MAPLFPTAYLPTIAYFATLAHHEKVCIEQHETFPKQTLRNRAVIMTANGPMPLVVPIVRTQGNHTRTEEIEISYAERWNIQHWRSIETAYNSSPYFLYYKDGIEKIILTPHNRLIDLNLELTQHILRKIKINCELVTSEEFIAPNKQTLDYRSTFTIKKECAKYSYPNYSQVFEDKLDFAPDLSIIDALFNLGPDTKRYLENVTER